MTPRILSLVLFAAFSCIAAGQEPPKPQILADKAEVDRAEIVRRGPKW
jgi:hypothetical protein